ncbi:hypothetical protein ACFFMN_26660 [Planobispora siamensis]|uniref:Integral membrane protein n=1 Tax=Planobispora siamensis TaxID=936338 RepID=A0A8J3WIN3_9ACTN|nr:hypothetical protein [Planobispora siamensis]GIH90753.1 hypothetical protein Psi01_13830 [Planobispora siamensis]
MTSSSPGSSSAGNELRATVAARRDLGPEFEDSLIEGFLEKVDLEIDRRVDERIARQAGKLAPAVNPTVAAGQRLALAIVSMVLGVGVTIALPFAGDDFAYLILVAWAGIIAVNFAFARGGRER